MRSFDTSCKLDHMSEHLSRSGEKPKLSVTEEEARSSLELRAQYLEERIVLRNSGASVWMLNNFVGSSDTGPGVVADFYMANRWMGYIEGDDLDGYQVYGLPVEIGKGSQHLNAEPIELRSLAEKTLQDYVSETFA